MKLKLKLEYSDKTSCFELELFFQAALEIFLWGLRQLWRYLGGALNLVLCVSKKIVTIRRTNLNICQENSKKLRFWKMKLKVKLQYSDKISCFELELFFQVFLENFLWGLRQRSRYLGRSLDIGLSSARRIMVIRHVEAPQICFIYIFLFASSQFLHLRITTFICKNSWKIEKW